MIPDPAAPLFADRALEKALGEGRPTWALVDLDAVEANLAHVARPAGGPERILAVVKADAYGLGARRIAATLHEAGIRHFGVASVEEGEALRGAGLEGSILLLGGCFPEQASRVAAHDLTAVVFDGPAIRSLARSSRGRDEALRVHLKVDTGMGRLGVPLRHLQELLEDCPELAPGGDLVLEGVLTHLARADERTEEARASCRGQMERFEKAVRILRDHGHGDLQRHVAGSAALLDELGAGLDLVRPGIALYGVDPRGPADLEPVLHLCTRVLYLKEVAAGDAVGYGSTWRAPGPRRIATLPVGYHDGYDRRLSNDAEVRVRGRRCPVVGRISMDLVTVDVTQVPAASTGDTVWLLGGPQGEDPPVALTELAQRLDVIPYEILCGIGDRVPRLYLRGGNVVDGPDLD